MSDVLNDLQSMGQDDALDLVFGAFHDAIDRRDWDWCDDVLTNIDLDRMSTHLTIGFLSASLPAKFFMRKRDRFVDRVEAWLPSQGKTPDQVFKLLRGLR